MVKSFFFSMHSLIFNLTLLIILIFGIQNSQKNQKVTLLNFESIEMPVSFIAGTSFIAGSLYSSIFFSLLAFNKDKNS